MSVSARTFLLAAFSLGCSVVPAWMTLSRVSEAQNVAAQGAQRSVLPPNDPQRLREEIKAVEDLLPRLPERGAALYLLAHHYARLGNQAKALELLKKCVSLDEGFDPSQALAFTSLKSNPEFQGLVERVRHRYPPVHQAQVAFTVAQSDLFPEGLAVDTLQHVFYMGSMHHDKIVKFTEAGDIADFVKEDMYDLMPVGGVHIDPADSSVWCATDPGEKNRSEIVHFDTQGKLLERYAAPGAGPHDLNDLVLRGRSEIYVTDTYGNNVFRFDRQSHQFVPMKLRRPVFYPNGITLSADDNMLYVADILGVIQVDLRTNQDRDVRPRAHDTLAGVDGLYWYDGSLVGVQYGTGASRVIRWKLSPDGGKASSSEILERGTELVKDPTTGAILEGNFYFMANTGIDNLDEESGNIIDPAKLEPLHIAVVRLKY